MGHTATFLITILLLIHPVVAADLIVGEWLRDDKSSRIQIRVTGGKLSGVITYVKDPKRKTDSHNPNKSKRSRPLVGLKVLSGFTKKGAMWEGGTIYDPSNGKIYKGKVWVQGEKLTMRGYVGVSLIGRTTTWTRHK